MPQYARYAVEKSNVNRMTIEDVVYIGAVAIQLIGEPVDSVRLRLLVENLFYPFPYLHIIWEQVCAPRLT